MDADPGGLEARGWQAEHCSGPLLNLSEPETRV
jgi:hypothetical protein